VPEPASPGQPSRGQSSPGQPSRQPPARVALVLGTSAGGVGAHVRALATGLAGRGHAVVVTAPAATGRTFAFATRGVRFTPVEIADRPRPGRDARAVALLRRTLRGADVVHAHGLRAGALAALALLGMRTRPPLVVTLHNAVLAGGPVRLAYGALEHIVARRADLVLGVSPDLEERMRRLGAGHVAHALVPAPAARPHVRSRADVRRGLGLEPGLRHTTRPDTPSPQGPSDEDVPLVLTVARLAQQKGLGLLLDAAARLGQRSPRPLLVVAGDGPERAALQARIEAERLPVRLLGRREDVPDLMAAADVVVLPSRWEGQPLVVQEALRAGAPLVATAVGGTPALTGPDGALLVPYGRPEELAAAVAALLDDPARRRALSAAALDRAGRLPNEAGAVSQVEALYRRLLT
jgi:glycosyltransferase involved in cell wall biosynthesis